MPIIVPPFVQYQSPIVPLRGLWNHAPAEGDRFANVEIDWVVTTGGTFAVQIAMSANSPVAISQIAALSVDNKRCAADVSFVFPDSGYVLEIPAFSQGVYPVFTNALTFYVVAPLATTGDVTIAQVLNSIPPVVAIPSEQAQSTNAANGVLLSANSTTQLVPATVSGLVEGMLVTFNISTGGVAQSAGVVIRDGVGDQLWATTLGFAANVTTSYVVPINPVRLRFYQGIQIVISGTTMSAGTVFANVYYSVPG